MAQTVLITGASSGIGHATARLFQQKGWNVVATMRNPDAGKDLAALPGVTVLRLDVCDQTTIDQAIADTLGKYGAIDVLVNNAGYALWGIFEGEREEQMSKQFDTNVLGMMRVTKTVFPHLREKRDGAIVNVSSMLGLCVAMPFGSVYAATKYAVEGFSESLFYEAIYFNVKVKLVEPGAVKTNFYSSIELSPTPDTPDYEGVTDFVKNAVNSVEDVGLTPEEVAEVIHEAAIDESATLRYIAGEENKQLYAMRRAAEDDQFMDAIWTQNTSAPSPFQRD